MKQMDNFLNEKDELLTPNEKEEEKKWDHEFQKRRVDLEREKSKLMERKRRSCSRLESLSIRWRNLEHRRTQRFHVQRTATTLQPEVTSAPTLPDRGNTIA